MRSFSGSKQGQIAFLFCLILTPSGLLASRFGILKSFLPRQRREQQWLQSALLVRGGDQEQTLTLDEKVQKAMQKLGIEQPATEKSPAPPSTECKDGVCSIPSNTDGTTNEAATSTGTEQEDVNMLADKIVKDMKVDHSLAFAALGATSTVDGSNSRTYNEAMARAMIQQELDMIDTVPEDSQQVSVGCSRH